MVESYTETKRVYRCGMGYVILVEESGTVRLDLYETATAEPEKIRELGKMLCDVAATMESLRG